MIRPPSHPQRGSGPAFARAWRLTRSILVVFGLGVVSPLVARAQPGKQDDPLSFDRRIGGLLQKYCHRCHGGDRPRGDVDLKQDENPSLIVAHRATWETALELIRSGDMPPDDAAQPSQEERDAMITFLDQTLGELDCESIREPGRPVLRRLSHREYDLAIQDLTGLQPRLGENFPPDPTGYGFDNLGDVLPLQPDQIERYHDAAKQVIGKLIERRAEHPHAYAHVFFVQDADTTDDDLSDDRAEAEAILTRFATRAFRRPVDPRLVARMIELYERARAEGRSHDQAVGLLLEAVLISPRFLTRVEAARPDTTEPYPVDDYELATRLSFFLWSRGPDDRLMELAERGELSNPQVLESETRRMLADERAQGLVAGFFDQWLGLAAVSVHRPDPSRFPEFDEALRDSMRGEVVATLEDLVRQDRSVLGLLAADHVFVDERLAAFYGLADVTGAEVRRVTVTDGRRGGLLTSAALLMIQSDPQRTNVPRRGNFLAGTILGSAPPPPPPDVPPLDDSEVGTDRTLREVLERHRRDPACASCHARIDPLGFALQNYDAIGRWRDEEAGQPIDASGELPDGTRFAGPGELKQALLERREAFVETLSRSLTIYALGRGLVPEDECVIRQATAACLENEGRFSSLVLAIVCSYPFQYRRNPEF